MQPVAAVLLAGFAASLDGVLLPSTASQFRYSLTHRSGCAERACGYSEWTPLPRYHIQGADGVPLAFHEADPAMSVLRGCTST